MASLVGNRIRSAEGVKEIAGRAGQAGSIAVKGLMRFLQARFEVSFQPRTWPIVDVSMTPEEVSARDARLDAQQNAHLARARRSYTDAQAGANAHDSRTEVGGSPVQASATQNERAQGPGYGSALLRIADVVGATTFRAASTAAQARSRR